MKDFTHSRKTRQRKAKRKTLKRLQRLKGFGSPKTDDETRDRAIMNRIERKVPELIQKKTMKFKSERAMVMSNRTSIGIAQTMVTKPDGFVCGAKKKRGEREQENL